MSSAKTNRVGIWAAIDHVQLAIPVGGEDPFVPARKAHPALTMDNLCEFIAASGLDATWNDEIIGVIRCHVFDPFGNRLELIQHEPEES